MHLQAQKLKDVWVRMSKSAKTSATKNSDYLLICVQLHLNGQTVNSETSGSFEPTQNDACSLKTEQKRTTTKNHSCTVQVNSFFVIVWC